MKRISRAAWSPRGIRDLEPAAFDAVRESTNSIVVAGPGAGKTELLAQRASYLLETGLCPPPFRILAISFKRDAAKNLRDRVALRCGSELGRRFESYTFDAWAKGLLDRFRLALPATYRPTEDYIIDQKFTNANPLRDRLLSISGNAGVQPQKIHTLDVSKFFQKWISGRPIETSALSQPGTGQALTAAFWKSSLHSGERSVIAFPMIGLLAELLLRSNPLLIKAMREAYQYVFLDEFQDTTGSQYRLLHQAFSGSNSVLTAVGDNKQRIMLWAGAQVGVFDAFTKDFDCHRHGLVMNYRSAPRLVAIQRHIIAILEPGSPPQQAADDGIDGEGECRLLEFDTDTGEAETLSKLISEWINTDGIRPTDICILVRQLPDIYTAGLRGQLQAREINSRVQNDLQDLLSEPLTGLAINFFRVCTSNRAPEQWQNLCESVLRLRGCDDSDDQSQQAISELSAFLIEIRPSLQCASTEEEIATCIRKLLRFLDENTFRRMHEQYLQTEFFEQTTESVAKHLSQYRIPYPDWPQALDAFLGVNCVPIMSIHKSKGLEFHSVVLLGLEDYPFRGLTSDVGEEDCNFFVAFSRAKKRVIFTSANVRMTSYGPRSQARTNVQKFYQLLGRAGVQVEG